MSKWFVFCRERFSPLQYIPMIAVFLGTNIAFVFKVEGESAPTRTILLMFVIFLSFFFRMRLFDEIKDYEVDLKFNPSRPLARGLLKVTDVKKMLGFLFILEFLIALSLGQVTFIAWLVAAVYSLLMYKEFFIGPILRPHLTTYAITHTFVINLLAVLAMLSVSKGDISYFSRYHFAFVLMNWCYFNLFEFARKTFAAIEERSEVDTYSSLFGTKGAFALSVKEVFLGLGLLYFCYQGLSQILMPWQFYVLAGAGVGYFLIGLLYFIKPTVPSAKLFRHISGFYLLTHYVLLLIFLK